MSGYIRRCLNCRFLLLPTQYWAPFFAIFIYHLQPSLSVPALQDSSFIKFSKVFLFFELSVRCPLLFLKICFICAEFFGSLFLLPRVPLYSQLLPLPIFYLRFFMLSFYPVVILEKLNSAIFEFVKNFVRHCSVNKDDFWLNFFYKRKQSFS